MGDIVTFEEAERLGREAVALGFPNRGGVMAYWTGVNMDMSGRRSDLGGIVRSWKKCWPDFRDELTALVCIPWFASHYPDHDITIDYNRDGTVSVTAAQDGTGGNSMDAWLDFDGATLVHACIEGVKAAQETTP